MKEDEAIRYASLRICGCREQEYRMLYRWATEDLDGSIIIEIGAGEGGGTVMLAAACQEVGGHLYVMDPFHLGGIPGQEQRRKAGGLNHYTVFEINNHRLIEAGLREYVSYQIGDSQRFAKDIRFVNDVRLLWIDGEHRYPFALNEFLGFGRSVVSGGVVAFHDAFEMDRAGRCIAQLIQDGMLAGWEEIDLPDAESVKGETVPDGNLYPKLHHWMGRGQWNMRAWRRL
jgi:hypothetical protein